MTAIQWVIAKALAEGRFPPPPLTMPPDRWWERLYPTIYGRRAT